MTTLPQRDPIREFQEYNAPLARRSQALVRIKIDRMAENAFAYFRGSYHLFARDFASGVIARSAPDSGTEQRIVGDVHDENYGTIKAQDDAIHYDINDFDETSLGPLELDICRLSVSWILAADDRSAAVARACIDGYVSAAGGKIEPEAERCPAIDKLIASATDTKRSAFIDSLTEQNKNRRRVKRSAKYFELPKIEHDHVLELLQDYRRRMPAPSQDSFYEAQDVCGRVAGIGSLGRQRYALLINGKGTPTAPNLLLEFKEAYVGGYDLARKRSAAASTPERAEEVISMQRRSQRASNRFLGFAVNGHQSFQVRELSPHEARIDYKALKGPEAAKEVAAAQGRILARVHRTASRGAHMEFELLPGVDRAFGERVLASALAYADVTRHDWKVFVNSQPQLIAWLESKIG
jgi:uncharacterized protein (DUF2252 family)